LFSREVTHRNIARTTGTISRNDIFYLKVKADISLWLQFLDNFNGQCFFPEKDWISNETLKLFTDSSGNPELDCGVYFNGLWAQLRWPYAKNEDYVYTIILNQI
jgi:hypothetical protein